MPLNSSDAASRWAGSALVHPEFWVSGNPIPTKGALLLAQIWKPSSISEKNPNKAYLTYKPTQNTTLPCLEHLESQIIMQHYGCNLDFKV